MPTQPTPITALPTPPSAADPENFDDRGDAFLGALADPFVDEFNAETQKVYDNAVEAAQSAETAGQHKTDAQTAKGQAEDARDAALGYRNEAQTFAASAVSAPGTNGVSTSTIEFPESYPAAIIATLPTGKSWVPGAWMILAVDGEPGTFLLAQLQTYNSANGAAELVATYGIGAGEYSNWVVSLTGPQGPRGLASLVYVEQTGNFSLVTADQGRHHRVTADAEAEFADAVDLPDAWSTRVEAFGAEVTITAADGNTIDGLPSYVMYSGEVRDFVRVSDTEIISVVLKSFTKRFTASGDFIEPPGYDVLDLDGVGGGGGGGGGQSGQGGGSAGGAGNRRKAIHKPTPGTVVSVTIGAGGSPGSGVGSNGSAGGNTTYGPHTWYGGGGGSGTGGGGLGGGGAGADQAGSAGGQGGRPALPKADGLTLNALGHGGGSADGSNVAGCAEWGGGAGGRNNGGATNGKGGSSLFGPGGGGGGSTNIGAAEGGKHGSYQPGGGGAAGSAASGGDGADGSLLEGTCGDGGGGGGHGGATGNGGKGGSPGAGGGGAGMRSSGASTGGEGGRGELVVRGRL